MPMRPLGCRTPMVCLRPVRWSSDTSASPLTTSHCEREKWWPSTRPHHHHHHHHHHRTIQWPRPQWTTLGFLIFPLCTSSGGRPRFEEDSIVDSCVERDRSGHIINGDIYRKQSVCDNIISIMYVCMCIYIVREKYIFLITLQKRPIESVFLLVSQLVSQLVN